MSGLGTGNINLLQTQKLSGTLAYFTARRNDYPLTPYLPLTTVDEDVVWLDAAKAATSGMTPATVPQTESPVLPMALPVGGRRSFEAIEWREKLVYTGNDARSIRVLGTHDDEIPTESVRESFRNQMRKRLDNRLEWMRAKVMTTGGLSVTFAGTSTSFSITYNHPSFLEPAAGTAWSNTASATPISDLAAWMELLRPIVHDYSFELLYNEVVEKYLRQNAGIQGLANDIFKYTNVSHAVGLGANPLQASNAVESVLKHYLGDVLMMKRIDAGIDYESDVSATANASQADVTCQSVEGFAAGQRVMISDRPSNKYHVGVVSSVNTTTRVVTLTANLAVAFPVGARIRTTDKFFSDSVAVLIPRYDESQRDTEGDDTAHGLANSANVMLPEAGTIGKIVSTRNRYLVNDNKPGYFAYVAEESGDPPRVEVVGGIMALPMIDYVERWLIADLTP